MSIRAKLVALAGLFTLTVTVWAAEAPQVMEARRLAEQARTYRVSAYPNVHNLPVADGPQGRLSNWQSAQAFDRAERSIAQDNYSFHMGLSVMGPTEPGLKVASTTYDLQHNDAATHQIATNGSGCPIHFAWTHWDVTPESLNQVDRFVNMNTYNSGTSAFLFGVNGQTLSDGNGGDPKKASGGFATLDIDDNNRAHVAFHARDAVDQPSGDYSSWDLDQSSSLLGIFTETQMFQSTGPVNPNQDDDRIWPHIAVQQISGNPDIYHVVAHSYASNDNIYYWRFKSTDVPQWKGPYILDSTPCYSYNIACDRTSNKVALITEDANATGINPNAIYQITYREDPTNGNGFGPVNTASLGDANEHFVTNYNTLGGPGSWLQMVGDYDNAGDLHIIWNEQRDNSGGGQGQWRHWDKTSGVTSTISQAYYDNKGTMGGRDINIACPTLGFGNGATLCGGVPNLNYLYLSFVQFGGTSVAQQNDMSSKGYMNGEIYLSVSNNGGASWSPPINLTNSMKPGCDPAAADSCPSENFPSIARTIDDTIHIMYIADRDAGDAVFGQGVWTFNPVMYLRIPGGTNVHPVCPLIAPNFGAELSDSNGSDCEYNTPPNTTLYQTLTLSNVGNASMTGVVSKQYLLPASGTWLQMTGLGSYTIPAGGANLISNVTMNAAGLAQGLYRAQISITHTDPTKATPFIIPVDFFVFTDFACPQYVVLHTKWLQLEVSNVNRVAMGPTRSSGGKLHAGSDDMPISHLPSPSRLRGMYWPPYAMRGFGPTADSGFNTIYDGSFFIGRAPYDASVPPDGILDTVVYRYVFGQGNFAKGFRSLSDLILDTNAYGSGAGVATVRANQTTIDSLIGVDVKYEAPESDDSSQFVLVKYRIFNRTANTYSGLMFGECTDFDVVPSTVAAGRQSGSQNTAGFSTAMNLMYQQGVDSSASSLNQAEKYLGGMTAIQCTAVPRAWSAPNDPWLFKRPGEGFHEGYIYAEMMKNGFEIKAPSPTPTAGWVDMHSVVGFDRNVTLTPTTVKHYIVGFVSSRSGPSNADLIAQTKKAWKFAFGWEDFVSADSIAQNTPTSYPYYAIGAHENGPTSGCCGCVIIKTSDPGSKFSFTPDTDPCTGTINFAGAAGGTFTATFRLSTPTCAGPTYTEDRTITINTGTPSCYCPHQGDIVLNGLIDVSDVLQVITVAFVNGDDITDPLCPTSRCDVDNSGLVDVQDVCYIVRTAFTSGPNPLDPCGGPFSTSTSESQTAANQVSHVPAWNKENRSESGISPATSFDPNQDYLVAIESKTVLAGSSTTVGIALSNSTELEFLVCPLEIRTVSGGAYVTALAGQRTPGGRLVNALSGISQIDRYLAPDGSCKSGQPGGYRTPVAPSYSGPWSSPDAISFVCGRLDPSSPTEQPLTPGSDPPGGSLQLLLTVNNSPGQFEIDTACTSPGNHVLMLGSDCAPIIPSLAKGVIQISSEPAAETLFVSVDGFPGGLAGSDATGNGSRNAPYRQISRAMQDVSFKNTHVIFVSPSRGSFYSGPVSYLNDWALKVVSEKGADSTLLTSADGHTVVDINADTTREVLEGFTIADNVIGGCVGACSGGINAFGRAWIINNKILRNVGGVGGGGINYSGVPGYAGVIAGNWIAGNSDQTPLAGGGIQVDSSTSLWIVNNTIASNTAQNGAGIFLSAFASGVTIANNIIAYNKTGYGIYQASGPAPLVSYNLFYQNGSGDVLGLPTPGGSNLFGVGANPFLTDLNAGDYHLTCGSPARNSGSNDLVPNELSVSGDFTWDLDGPPQARYFQTTIDMGGDEFWDNNKKADFFATPTVGCVPLTVAFTNQSLCVDEQWTWDFGDGQTISGPSSELTKSPTHQYDTAGTYAVRLIAKGDLDSDTLKRPNYIRVSKSLTPDFTANITKACDSLRATFTATLNDFVDSLRWYFGDGDSAIMNPVSHQFTTSGMYNVELRAYNSCGAVSKLKSQYITVGRRPSISITASSDSVQQPICGPYTVRLHPIADQPLLTYNWDFGDTDTTGHSQSNPSHTYLKGGTYSCRLIAGGDCGSDTALRADYIQIQSRPTATLSAGPITRCTGSLTADFSATYSGTVYSSVWYFGDGGSAPGPVAQHSYSNEGVYHPSLVLIHLCGTDTLHLSTPITVGVAPVAGLSGSPLSGYEPLTVQFTDSSRNSAISWHWAFGDAGESPEENPAHVYTAGSFDVSLLVSNACGASADTQPKYVNVGGFQPSLDSSGAHGDTILYSVLVDSLFRTYDRGVSLSVGLTTPPRRGAITLDLKSTSGTPRFATSMTALPSGDLATGDYTMELSAIDPRITKTASQLLHYAGRQFISVTPETLQFGPMVIGGPYWEQVSVRNNASTESGYELKFTASITGLGFGLGPSDSILYPGASGDIQVSFTPAFRADYSGTLLINSDDPAKPVYRVLLLGRGSTGLNPPVVSATMPPSMLGEIRVDSAVRFIFSQPVLAPSADSLVIVGARRSGKSVSGALTFSSGSPLLPFNWLDFKPLTCVWFPPDDTIDFRVRAVLADTAGDYLDGNHNGSEEGSPTDDYLFLVRTGPGVWPGDADQNKRVDEGDVLPLARFWGFVGPARDNPCAGFAMQPATAWTPWAATYADADGNGVIDSADICPIVQYFDVDGIVSKAAVESWMTEARGWDHSIIRALIGGLINCPDGGRGQAVLHRFLEDVLSASAVPDDYSLDQNYPNPFNPMTVIEYTLKQQTKVRVEVFDTQGRLITVLEDGEEQPGRHSRIWDGTDAKGRAVASGIYFYRLVTPEFRMARKMVLMK